jgi:hypothetical protein
MKRKTILLTLILLASLLISIGCTDRRTKSASTDESSFPLANSTSVNNVEFLGEIEGESFYFIHDTKRKVGIWYSVGHGHAPAISIFVLPDNEYLQSNITESSGIWSGVSPDDIK